MIACDRKQARVIHRYARALLIQVPAIAGLVERDGDEEIDLSNGVTIANGVAASRLLWRCRRVPVAFRGSGCDPAPVLAPIEGRGDG